MSLEAKLRKIRTTFHFFFFFGSRVGKEVPLSHSLGQALVKRPVRERQVIRGATGLSVL